MFPYVVKLLSVLAILGVSASNFARPVNDQASGSLEHGDLVYQAEKLLAEMGYWITKIDRVKDSSTYHAVAAFQKVEGRKRTGKLNARELAAIRRSKRPVPVFTGEPHIEIDLERQVLFLTDNMMVTHILPVSTGNGKAYYLNGKRQVATTPRGIFEITRQIKGIRRAPLGTLYHPSYFYGGVAIHGSNSIPFYPASHGCVRIPRFASKKFSDLVYVGMKVAIYESAARARQVAKSSAEPPEIPGIGTE